MTVGPMSIATSAGIFQKYLPANRSTIPSGMNWRYCDQFCIVMRVPGGMVAAESALAAGFAPVAASAAAGGVAAPAVTAGAVAAGAARARAGGAAGGPATAAVAGGSELSAP